MTPRQKTLVRETFGAAAPMAEQVAAMFYARLFETNPSLRALFKIDIREQGRKLITTLAYCVGKLDALDELVPAVKSLGLRHAGYGVAEADYAAVGAALLWTLEQGLGAAFTPEVKDAWATVYGILSTTMIEGARAGQA